jgi:hypothetical protein
VRLGALTASPQRGSDWPLIQSLYKTSSAQTANRRLEN